MKKLSPTTKISFIIGTFLVTPLASFAFSDVNSSTEYSAAIDYAQSQQIISGYPDGTFKPNNTMNRVELVKIIVGATQGYNSSQDPSGFDIYSRTGLSFPDIEAGQWYIPYLRKAVQTELVAGYPDGTFKPEATINFVEAAKIIVNGFDYKPHTYPETWYKPYVEVLAEYKAIPTSIKNFDAKITRAEFVEIIYRLKNKITTKDSLTYGELAKLSVTPKPTIGSCQIFPSDNAWNQDISNAPLDPNSANYINNIGGSKFLHADFGGNGEYGIPYNIVEASQPKVNINITDYPDESDAGPYPIPLNAPIENGGDRHVLTVDKDGCMLYELYGAERAGNGWEAASAAKFDLKSNALRPEGWTSADAAGLPIFPGLARYDEVAAGAINHALRFTVSKTQKGYIYPATHYASSSTDPNRPPMGLRLRLKANFDTSKYTGQSKIILEALKKYGMIVADNGSDWYISGAMDTRWDDDDLNQLKEIPGSVFEVVQTGPIHN